MKRSITSLAVLLLVAAACAPAKDSVKPAAAPAAPASTTGPVSLISMTPAALLEKAVEAFGGASVIDGVRGIELDGSSQRVLRNGQGASMLITSYIQFPDLYRQEVLIQQARIVTLVNKEGAFLFTELAGNVKLPDEERGSILNGVRRNPVALLQRRGDALATLAAPEMINGKPVAVVRMEESTGATTVVIDPATGDIVQIRYPTSGGGEDKTQQMIVTYDKYKKVNGGLRFPFHSEGMLGDRPAFVTEIDSVVVNPTLQPSTFATPESAPEVNPSAAPAGPRRIAPPQTPAGPPPQTPPKPPAH